MVRAVTGDVVVASDSVAVVVYRVVDIVVDDIVVEVVVDIIVDDVTVN